jgi:hypothetical protein
LAWDWNWVLATVIADIALGHPVWKARWVMVSMSSSSVTPFCLAKGRWKVSCSMVPPAMRAATVARAPVAFGQSGAFPDLVEEDLVGVVDESGREVAERALAAGPSLGLLGHGCCSLPE